MENFIINDLHVVNVLRIHVHVLDVCTCSTLMSLFISIPGISSKDFLVALLSSGLPLDTR